MTDTLIRVVGNKFQELSNAQSILTFDELVTRVREGQLEPAAISLEQGISESQVDVLRDLVAQSNHAGQISLRSYFDSHQRCDGALTHKTKRSNTLISDPHETGEDTYASVLLIDDDCADLSDHVTGKHVQFMVLLEAARQMGNAVTQKFHSTAAKMYLAENINVDFKAFAYPFRVDLEYRVLERNLRTTGDGKMAVQIDFRQQGRLIAQLTLTFTVLDRKFVSALESTALKSLHN